MRDSGTENTEMTENDEKRKAVLSSVLETLDAVTAESIEAGEGELTKLYLLGAYTVLRMLGVATYEEYKELCDEAHKL